MAQESALPNHQVIGYFPQSINYIYAALTPVE